MQIMCTFAADGRLTIPPMVTIMQANYYEIKVERFNQGYTQAELAKKAGIGLRTLIKAECGQSISPRTNKAIKDALGLK